MVGEADVLISRVAPYVQRTGYLSPDRAVVNSSAGDFLKRKCFADCRLRRSSDL